MVDQHVILFDGSAHKSLLPLTFIRPVATCMIGMHTIAEQWKRDFDCSTGYLTQAYIQDNFPLEGKTPTYYINGACLPSKELIAAIRSLKDDEVLIYNSEPIAFHGNGNILKDLSSLDKHVQGLQSIKIDKITVITYPEDILSLSITSFLKSYKLNRRESQGVPASSRALLRGNDIFIGKNVKIYDAILNATDGPIFIDDDAEIMENAVIKGPAYIGNGTKIHVSSKIYSGTFLGPQCRMGGEVKRTQIFGYTNKGHDGYLGDSVLGKWCNLGAATDNSNMKNTYGKVSLWDIANGVYRTTEKQFLGMILGDHTMAAIKTSFNTGSVTGVCANLLDRNPNRYTPSFSWGKDQKYKIDKALEVANQAMGRRGKSVEPAYEKMLRHLHNDA